MQAPEFWSGQARGRDAAPVLQALLAPAGFLYGAAAAARRRWTRPAHVSIPVVCVGNLTLGGAGKTPIARALRAMLGPDAHVLLRGYGGDAEGPLRVDPDASFRHVGDEALLHAADGPTWIARDRVAGARAAEQAGARVIVMDDGFQNPTLHKDVSIVVIDAQAGVGNGRIFPAGPLRERLTDGIDRADAFVVLDPSGTAGVPPTFFRQHNGAAEDAGGTAAVRGNHARLREALARRGLRARLEPVNTLPAGPLVAFAGIARPMKFFDTLKAMDAQVVEAAPFPDHHAFSGGDLEWLSKLAADFGATLVTTEKDHVRLDPPWRAQISVLKVRAKFEDDAALEPFLAPVRARLR
jgi:tetraacyldisaccharide 4'-kinase